MKVINSVFEKSSKSIDQCPESKLPEYALVGRSNVGKSSLINSLLNNKKIAKTSSTPGKTILINHFKINKSFYLVDLPGYGYATLSKKIKEEIKKTHRSYFKLRKQLSDYWDELPESYVSSSKDKSGIDNIFNFIEDSMKEYQI